MKVLPKDVNSYLAPCKNIKEHKFEPDATFNDKPVSELGFTSGGDPEVPCPICETILEDGSENPNCFAKRISFNSEDGIKEKYFVKVGLNGFMFDPWGVNEGHQNKYAKLHGKPAWSFAEVNSRSFEFYKTFLQTRNRAWKNNAEREIKNA